MERPDVVAFRCNVCGHGNADVPVARMKREAASCAGCASSVRLRGIVHHLSLGLFGVSLPLPDFPVRPDVAGIGLSDWNGYALTLARRLNYWNTFYHQEPFLDIAAPPAGRHRTCDFVISSDVFEHVPAPVERAFAGAFALLKPGGLLVLTVPFTALEETVEHFPGLGTHAVVAFDGGHVLLSRDAAGRYEVRDRLVFHGGPGEVLEMRSFSRAGTLRLLADAGFEEVVVHAGDVPQWGILPPHPYGLPITARRPPG